ncbi:MAG: serine protease [Patescibacteria group bacterium]|nr:serine protease [Patescibacteria group bacterium]
MCTCNDPPRNQKAPPLLRLSCVAGIAAMGLLLPLPASAQPRQARIHPAVVRVIVQDESGRSHGSGALVASTDSLGLVLTNWHVVRDAAAPPVVVFPDGFQSGATIAKVDRDWDLAALVIWRPHVAPIALASAVPRPGDPLAIAGYGKGQYQVDTGRCTQYLSPGRHHPYELVELAASARQGDSGGPIFNDRGELAGVLFGSAFGRTTGSHSGRVRQFLAPLWHDFYQQRPDANTMIATRPPLGDSTQPNRPVASIPAPAQAARPAPGLTAGPSPTPTVPPGAGGVRPTAVSTAPSFAGVHAPIAPSQQGFSPGANPATGGSYVGTEGTFGPWVSATDAMSPDAMSPDAMSPDVGLPDPMPSRSEQLKTILAVIGILALVFHGVRLLGRAVEV